MLLTIVGIVILLIVLLMVILFIIYYNKFQVLKNGSEAGISQIAVALKKRLDMITALIEIVKSYAKFERGVFESITQMRSQISQTETTENINRIDRESKGILDKILVVVENYPNLKASENVASLMKTISEVEDEIARQRYTYNNIVQDYNTRCSTFPSNMVSKIFSFKKLQYLEFEKEVEKRPDGTWNQ
jgi:LemA protein